MYINFHCIVIQITMYILVNVIIMMNLCSDMIIILKNESSPEIRYTVYEIIRNSK